MRRTSSSPGTSAPPSGDLRAGRTSARLAKHLELALSAVDLSLPQFRMLVYLSDGSAPASAMASKLAVSRPSVTALVDGLVSRGLVVRGSDAGDKRRVTLRLTPKGRRALAAADGAVDTRLLELASLLEPAERRRALDALALWERALDARGAHVAQDPQSPPAG